ncbi:RTA1 like protein-domain-containing protein [Kickxella alabastrina]|uniref:RTA1 like protein-domain-containing protein n=1 Tax=Kickxella alabastrina TaxID=61397 RepID=UPI00221E7B79|nr:RTA1 like protein-domain-containing protein [Kickxella alabastrina]KAI7833600.1 RTA1 like protein-domain-containing protein [Kickxella alabastrina]
MSMVQGPPDVDLRLRYFRYMPANVYPQVAAGFYFAIGVILIIQTIRSKAQAWLYVLAGTAIFEAVGYAFRAACVYETTLVLFLLQLLIILLPINAIALFNYKVTGKIISDSLTAKPKYFWLRPKFVYWFYFASDVFSVVMQGAGGAMMGKVTTRAKAKTVALIGLCVQLLFLGCYMATTVYVWRKPEYVVHAGPRDKSPQAAKRKIMVNIISTTTLLYVRSIYRIAEFADNTIYSTEWAFYVFDTLVIFFAFVVYIVLFIGPNFPRKSAGLEKQLSYIPVEEGNAQSLSTRLTDKDY